MQVAEDADGWRPGGDLSAGMAPRSIMRLVSASRASGWLVVPAGCSGPNEDAGTGCGGSGRVLR